MKGTSVRDFRGITHLFQAHRTGGQRKTRFTLELKQMENLRNPEKGLSVWMWGPIMWSVLHALAFLCDTVNAPTFDANSIDAFFKYVQPMLPCVFCRDSYGGFLEDVIRTRQETVKVAFEKRHMVAFVVDVHNKVNTKLATQRWNQVVGVLRSKLSETACKELFSCEGLEQDVAVILDKRPTLTVVRNRAELFRRDVVNVEGLLLLLLVFAYRVQPSQVWNLILILATLSTFLRALPRDDAQEAGRGLESATRLLETQAKAGLFQSETLVDALHNVLFVYSKPVTSPASFRIDTEQRLVLMLAKACGQGTCK
jgi:hypothetical protein